MKKGWLFLLLILFPILVNAKDEIIIDKYDVKVSVLGENSYYYNNTFYTKIIYGENPSTYFVRIRIPNKGPYKYENKVYNYDVELKDINFVKAQNGFYLEEDDYHVMVVGTNVKLFNEEDILKLSYYTKQTGDKLERINDLNFILVDSEYDVNNVTFKIVLPEESEDYSVKFSIDGKKYYKGIEHLEYKRIDNIIEGEYLKKLEPEQKIYVKLENKKMNIDYRKFVVYTSIFSVIIALIYLIKNISRKKH